MSGTALVAVGDNLESAIAAVMYHARTLVKATNTAAAQPVPEHAPEGDVQPQWYEKWYDGLGYCKCDSVRVCEHPPDQAVRHLELPRPGVDGGQGFEGAGHAR